MRNNKDTFYAFLSILGFVAICGLLWFGDAAPRPAKRLEPVKPYSDPYQSYELIRAHNAARKARGVSPVDPHVYLVLAARRHAQAMADCHLMTHGDLGQGATAERVNRTGYRYSKLGENVAAGQRTREEVMKGWLASPGHRTNILGEYQHMGAAVAYSRSGQPYWCAVFGSQSR